MKFKYIAEYFEYSVTSALLLHQFRHEISRNEKYLVSFVFNTLQCPILFQCCCCKTIRLNHSFIYAILQATDAALN